MSDRVLDALQLKFRKDDPAYYIRALETAVHELSSKVDRLETAVIALCEQDGEVTYERQQDEA